MCLNTITKVYTLTEDLTVYKVVGIDKKGRYVPPQHSGFWKARRYMSGLNKTNPFGLRKITTCDWSKPLESYVAGYHSLLHQCDAKEWEQLMISLVHQSSVVKCVIPAGTEVTEGIQRDYPVIVSRRLIFPDLEKL